jgi:O-acetyl-ADP-ribose deacetylase (regulator of RNase III)
LRSAQPQIEFALEISTYLFFQIAEENQIASLGIPVIGTGVFKFPPQLAATINARVTRQALAQTNCIKLVRFCVVSEELKQLYESALT